MKQNLGENGIKTVLLGDKISVGELMDKIQGLNSENVKTSAERKIAIRQECARLVAENPGAAAWWKS